MTRRRLTRFEWIRRTLPTLQSARSSACPARASVLPLTLGTLQKTVALMITETESSYSFAVTRSGARSPSRSPIATESAICPASHGLFGSKLPAPRFAKTETPLSWLSALTRSALPSRFRSPIATDSGVCPL